MAGGDDDMTSDVVDAEVLVSPGGYGDGPVHIRVERQRAGSWRPPPDHDVVCNDSRCRRDPSVRLCGGINTHNAFIYVDRMIEQGVPVAALPVIRLPPAVHPGDR